MDNLGTHIREFAAKYRATMQAVTDIQREVHSNDPETAIHAVLAAAGIIERAHGRQAHNAAVAEAAAKSKSPTTGSPLLSSSPTHTAGTGSPFADGSHYTGRGRALVPTPALHRLQAAIDALKDVNAAHGSSSTRLLVTPRGIQAAHEGGDDNRARTGASTSASSGRSGDDPAVLLPDTERNLLLLRLQLFVEDMNKVVEELLAKLPSDDGNGSGSDGDDDVVDPLFAAAEGDDEVEVALAKKRRQEAASSTCMRTLREKATLPAEVSELQELCEDLHERQFTISQKLRASEKQKEELLYRLNAREGTIRGLRSHFYKQIIATIGGGADGSGSGGNNSRSSAAISEVSRFAGIPLDFIKEQDIEYARRLANHQLAMDELKGRHDKELASIRTAAKKQLDAKEKEIIQLQLMFRNALRNLQGKHALTVSKIVDENANLKQTGLEAEQLAMQRAEAFFEMKMNERIAQLTQEYEGRITSLEEQLEAANKALKDALAELKTSRRARNKQQKRLEWLQASLDHAMLVEFPYETTRMAMSSANQDAHWRRQMDELLSRSQDADNASRATIELLHSDIDNLKKEQEKLLAQIKEHEEKTTKHHSDYAALQDRLREVQRLGIEKDRKIQLLQSELDVLRRSSEGGSSVTEEWSMKLKDIQEQLAGKADVAVADLKEAQKEVQHLKDTVQQLKETLTAKEAEVEGVVRKQSEELAKEKTEVKDQMSELQARYDAANAMALQYVKTIEQLQAELEIANQRAIDAESAATAAVVTGAADGIPSRPLSGRSRTPSPTQTSRVTTPPAPGDEPTDSTESPNNRSDSQTALTRPSSKMFRLIVPTVSVEVNTEASWSPTTPTHAVAQGDAFKGVDRACSPIGVFVAGEGVEYKTDGSAAPTTTTTTGGKKKSDAKEVKDGGFSKEGGYGKIGGRRSSFQRGTSPSVRSSAAVPATKKTECLSAWTQTPASWKEKGKPRAESADAAVQQELPKVLEESVQCSLLIPTRPNSASIDSARTVPIRAKPVTPSATPDTATLETSNKEPESLDVDLLLDERRTNAQLRCQLADLHTRIRFANRELHAAGGAMLDEYFSDYGASSDGLSRSGSPVEASTSCEGTFLTATELQRRESSSSDVRLLLELTPLPLSRSYDITTQNREFRTEVLRRQCLLKDAIGRLQRWEEEQHVLAMTEQPEAQQVALPIAPTPPVRGGSALARPPTAGSCRSTGQPSTRPQSALVVRYHMSAMPAARRAMDGTDKPGNTLGGGFRMTAPRPRSGSSYQGYMAEDDGFYSDDFYEDYTEHTAAEEQFDAAVARAAGPTQEWTARDQGGYVSASGAVRLPGEGVAWTSPNLAMAVYNGEELPKYVYAIEKGKEEYRPQSARTAGGPVSGRLTPRAPMKDPSTAHIPTRELIEPGSYYNVRGRIQAAAERTTQQRPASSKLARMAATKGLCRGSPSSVGAAPSLFYHDYSAGASPRTERPGSSVSVSRSRQPSPQQFQESQHRQRPSTAAVRVEEYVPINSANDKYEPARFVSQHSSIVE